jgi:hypothetical protein
LVKSDAQKGIALRIVQPADNQPIILPLPACCSRGVSFIVASIVDNPDSRALPAVFDILNAFYIHYQ